MWKIFSVGGQLKNGNAKNRLACSLSDSGLEKVLKAGGANTPAWQNEKSWLSGITSCKLTSFVAIFMPSAR
jgi:hypothetical protein